MHAYLSEDEVKYVAESARAFKLNMNVLHIGHSNSKRR